MLKPVATTLLIAALAFGLAGCRDEATLPVEAGTGANPKLPPPKQRLIPTVQVAHAIGWPEGGKPTAAEALKVERFASGLSHPRWLYVLPNGDVLVAETNAPPQPEETGLMAWVTKMVMGWAGAGVPSPNRITLLRDAEGDGVAETKSTFLTGLNSPFGMALVGDNLYVANTDAVLRFPYHEGDTSITAQGTKVADLPAGPYNYHWTKSLVASRDGSKLFVGGGIEQQCWREWDGRRNGSRRHRRDRPGDGSISSIRHGPAQSGWARFRARERRALGRSQRA